MPTHAQTASYDRFRSPLERSKLYHFSLKACVLIKVLKTCENNNSVCDYWSDRGYCNISGVGVFTILIQGLVKNYWVFIIYCVFSQILIYIPDSVSSRCQCVYTHQAGKKTSAAAEQAEFRKFKKMLKKNTIFNEHPVYIDIDIIHVSPQSRPFLQRFHG